MKRKNIKIMTILSIIINKDEKNIGKMIIKKSFSYLLNKFNILNSLYKYFMD